LGENVSPRLAEADLQWFRETGSTTSLLDFVRGTGKDEQRYKEALDLLKPVFEALTFGWRPEYQNLDRNALRQRMTEVVDIITWMAGSVKADMKTRALELMGHLGWDPFFPLLQQHLASGEKWERLTAVRALGQTASDRTAPLLRELAADPDPEIRDAVRRLFPHEE
jgi:hypothetical protein